MVVHTLLWPDEIRDPDFPGLDTAVDVRAPELKMAGQVVESMASDFRPEEFTDTYQEQLRELVEAKLAGGEAFETPEAPARLDDTDDVSDLLAKLEASVRRRREEADAAAPKPTAAKATGRESPGEEARAAQGRHPARPPPKSRTCYKNVSNSGRCPALRLLRCEGTREESVSDPRQISS